MKVFSFCISGFLKIEMILANLISLSFFFDIFSRDLFFSFSIQFRVNNSLWALERDKFWDLNFSPYQKEIQYNWALQTWGDQSDLQKNMKKLFRIFLIFDQKKKIKFQANKKWKEKKRRVENLRQISENLGRSLF